MSEVTAGGGKIATAAISVFNGVPRDECCRVDDTSPERAITGLSPG